GCADRQEAIGGTLRGLVKPDVTGQREIFRAYIRSGYRVQDGLIVMATPEGDRHYLNNAFGVIEDGMHLRTWGTARDVTEKVRLEEALQRTQKLEAVGNLASAIAHDFNNLLTAIIGSLELAKLYPEHSKSEALDTAHAAAIRASALTTRLLGLARQPAPTVQPLDLNAVVVDLEPILRQLVGQSRRLTMTLHDDVVVAATRSQIEQVVVNLVVNARDATSDGAKIGVVTRVEGAEAVVEVRDDGPGIEPGLAEKIFEPFFTTKPEGKGTGLGLSTCRTVAESLGGQMKAASTVGSGTVFSLHLPLSNAELTQASPQRLEQGPGVRARKALVLEDHDDVRNVMVRSLRRAGFETVAFATMAQAKAHLQDGDDVELIVSDLMLPDGLGVELIGHGGSRVPIVFTSALDRGTLEELLRPWRTFLPKPFTQQQLIDAVALVMSHDRPSVDLHAP
ncbi:MAG: ATP-binding protein, partial [Polyangiaceae bacterium]